MTDATLARKLAQQCAEALEKAPTLQEWLRQSGLMFDEDMCLLCGEDIADCEHAVEHRRKTEERAIEGAQ